MTKMVLLGVVLWAGVTFGSHVAPYPLNLIVSSDITHPPPMYDFPFPSAQMLKRLPPVTAADKNRSISISKFSVAMLERLEDNLNVAGITPRPGSPARGLALLGQPSGHAMKYEKSSMIITKASQNLVWTKCTRYGLATDECASYVSTLHLRGSEYGGECAALERFACRSNRMASRYRSFDGSCNNPVRSSWGQALTGYKRLLHPRYADGIEEPRRAVGSGPLPSARLVSTTLADNLDEPDDDRTIALAVWSQFIHHDLVHTPVRRTIHTDRAIRCCESTGGSLAPRHLHPSCLPIAVPDNDPHFGHQAATCMEYARSLTTYRGDCTFGAAEQMNQATHFLDGSHIYGSNSRDAAKLREKTGGLLKTSVVNGQELLPLDADPTENCLVNETTDACFVSGDARANLHPWLGALHALCVREHNRLARALGALNAAWGADRLYHEARRVLVAQLQHIAYRHWLPALTGKSFDELFDGYDGGYNPDVDPSVTNAVATAGFHFVSSLLAQRVQLRDAAHNVSAHRLAHGYLNPALLARSHGLDALLRGMVHQRSQRNDFNYDDDVRQRWLGGLDALALDVQRGRDHGLPGYAQYRALCGLGAGDAFQRLGDAIPQQIIDKLAQVYEHPHDIDLVVGLMAEKPLPGSLLGPTATCLLKEQLWRTRAGDRYFYAHAGEAGAFSKRQLAELRRGSAARLLCDNTALRRVPRDVFRAPAADNPVVSCDEIKRVNLEAWRDPAGEPDILARTNKWLKNKVAGAGNSTR